jgi:hypothetical protein
MDVRLLTPLAALFAITAVVPIAVFLVRRRRLRSIRSVLGLHEPTLRSQLPFVLSLAAVPLLLGLAATQPVVETGRTVPERTDAQAFVVLDVSRSMLAASGAGAPTRFERAREIALGIREQLPEVPFGIASLTDRVLPHLFPTTDARVFDTTLARAIDIEQPPPGAFYLTFATNLNSLRQIPEKNYFPPTAKKRVVVVLTDGETQPVQGDLARAFRRRPAIDTFFVRLWDADERIYETGVAEGGYRPDSGSDGSLARAASLVGGQVFGEDDASRVAGAVREAIGEGETVARAHESGRFALMPYIALVAALPLGFVLVRRNVWWSRRLALRRDQGGAPETESSQARKRRLEEPASGTA